MGVRTGEREHEGGGARLASDKPRAAGSHWPRIVSGGAIAGSALVVVVTSWSALLANSLAYPLVVLAALVCGVLLVVTGVRSRSRAVTGVFGSLLRLLAMIGAFGLAIGVLVLRPYVATPVALEALTSDEAVTITDTRARTTYEPARDQGASLVLYPGARVDPRAYAVLARGIAEEGHRVVVLKCPFDIAFLCPLPPDPALTSDGPWVLAGHSLGGVVASQVADGEVSTADGLVFWASYPLPDLSSRDDLSVASILGERDSLTTVRDVTSRKDLLPTDTAYTLIPGAVHSYFGDYGDQPRDGEPTVDRDDAQAEIIQATVAALRETTASGPR